VVTFVEFTLVFIYLCTWSLRAGNAEIIVFIVGHDNLCPTRRKEQKISNFLFIFAKVTAACSYWLARSLQFAFSS
jgi:hypothetical protein